MHDDIKTIKETLDNIQKTIDEIKVLLKDDYMDGKIIDFYSEEEEKNYKRLKEINGLMELYLDQQKSFGRRDKRIYDMCERAIKRLHDEYIELTLQNSEENDEYIRGNNEKEEQDDGNP